MKVQLRSRRQITLPEEAVSELGINEGDEFIVKVEGDSLRLLPVVTIPRDEAYLFTPEWQRALQTAEKELREGEYETFASVDDLLKDLND
ncbi:MAG: AbrB/MazE/SpoVT family DNA-binding domain-containing protein [Calditrichaeota bacterium]|nr:AbrB/MazE/SpoVT family DNA-binding domain-containing protein [Calditrichota bacterium]